MSFLMDVAGAGLRTIGRLAEGRSRSQQYLMNAEQTFSEADAARADADSLRSDARAMRVTADNTRREADMEDLSTQLYGINAETARNNAKLLTIEAETTRASTSLIYAKTAVTSGRIAEEGEKTLAANRVFFAGNNLDASTGSPLLAMGRTAARVALDQDLAWATAHIEAVDALKRADSLDAAAAGESNKALSSTYSQLASSMRAESKRVLGFSQDDRAGSIDLRAGSMDRRAASIDRRGENYLDLASEADSARWLGAAEALLSGYSQAENNAARAFAGGGGGGGGGGG